jgi:hypothetical protein
MKTWMRSPMTTPPVAPVELGGGREPGPGAAVGIAGEAVDVQREWHLPGHAVQGQLAVDVEAVTSDVFMRDQTNGTTTRVSVSSGGQQGNNGSSEPATSADGHDVAFSSQASNLVADDTNGWADVFLQHRS